MRRIVLLCRFLDIIQVLGSVTLKRGLRVRSIILEEEIQKQAAFLGCCCELADELFDLRLRYSVEGVIGPLRDDTQP
jgi:hypothetical protein